MSYTMRFILTDGPGPTLQDLEGVLKAKKPAYAIDHEPDSATGDLFYRNEVYGEIKTTVANDETTAQELADLVEALPDAEEGDQAAVEAVLHKATAVVAVEFPTEEEPSGISLDVIDPLWQWLFANRQGLLQADRDGYYDPSGKVLSFPQ